MISKEQLNEFTQEVFKKDFGRVSKQEYCITLAKAVSELRKAQASLYWRDLFNNPCHTAERLNKGYETFI